MTTREKSTDVKSVGLLFPLIFYKIFFPLKKFVSPHRVIGERR